MGGGDLNLKKSWHPTTLKNMERVWKAEQKHEAEKKKIEELQRELAEERAREEIQHYAEDQGVVKKKSSERLDWMYEGPSAMVNREDYLLGRNVDKTFELLQQNELGGTAKAEGNALPESILKSSACNLTVDLANKIREDPLLIIRKQEDENKRKLLDNPVRMKQLQQLLHTMNSKKKKRKKEKKSKKSKKTKTHKTSKHQKQEVTGSSESDDEDDSEPEPARANQRFGNDDRSERMSGKDPTTVKRSGRSSDQTNNHLHRKSYRSQSSEHDSPTFHKRARQSSSGGARSKPQIEKSLKSQPSKKDSSENRNGDRRPPRDRSASPSRSHQRSSHHGNDTDRGGQREQHDRREQHTTAAPSRRQERETTLSNRGHRVESPRSKTGLTKLSRSRDRRSIDNPVSKSKRERGTIAKRDRSSSSPSSGSPARQSQILLKQSRSRDRRSIDNHVSKSKRERGTIAKRDRSSSSPSSGSPARQTQILSKRSRRDKHERVRVSSSNERSLRSPPPTKVGSNKPRSKRSSSSPSSGSPARQSQILLKRSRRDKHERVRVSSSNERTLRSPPPTKVGSNKPRSKRSSSSSRGSSNDSSRSSKKPPAPLRSRKRGSSPAAEPRRDRKSRVSSLQSSSPPRGREHRKSSTAAPPKGRHLRASLSRSSSPVPPANSHIKREPASPPASERPSNNRPVAERTSRSGRRNELSAEEKQRRLNEMMDNAKWRDDQRIANVRRHKAEVKLEKLQQMKNADTDFITPFLNKAADVGTVSSRIKSNIYNIQRTKAALDKNFTKR